MQFFEILMDIAVYALAGAGAAYFYYERMNRDLLGGFWGGLAIGMIGAVLISMLTGIDAWFIRLVTWLMQPKWGEGLLFRVNLIAAVGGAFIFVWILSRINQNRNRRRY